MTFSEMEFVIFCIEELAVECQMSGQEMYQFLNEKTRIIQEYIIPNYEVLHSMGRDAIVEDLQKLLLEKGGL